HDDGDGFPLVGDCREFVEEQAGVDGAAGAGDGNDNFVHVNTLKMNMQTRKYFKTVVLWAGLLGVVLLSGGARMKPAVGAVAAGDPESATVAERARGSVAWMTVDEAAGKLQQEKRPVLIDLYTSWCGWCKEMDRKTYSNK